jgi:DNA helicase-2/ATP-dependent DNA helicase PcrA
MLDEGDDRGEFDWNALLDDLGASAHAPRAAARELSVDRGDHGVCPRGPGTAGARRGPGNDAARAARRALSVRVAGEAVAWLAEALKQLARDEPDANVAVVARFAQQADVYFDGLARAEVPGVRRVAKQDFAWDPGST